jgi:acetylornithine aminotransferase
VLVEPIQGEAGILVPPPEFLPAVRALCDEHRVLLIADEIQSGLGRTGATFACDLVGVVPDLYLLGKALGGGIVPVSAVVGDEDVLGVLRPGEHGSTFGGNPLATAVAGAVLAEIEDAGLVANAAARGAQLRSAIEGMGSDLVSGVSGRGLLLGVVLARPVAKELAVAALQRGLIVNAASASRIRLAPPLIIGDAEVAEFTALFAAALAAVSASTPTPTGAIA